MNDPRYTNPYATPTPAGAITPDGTIAVRPDARTQAAFLTQAFLWMFAGLAVTAGVAFVVQGNARLLDFARGAVLPLIIFQLVVVFAIQLGIRRMSATLGLGLFFVYAASLGLTVGLIVSLYTSASVATAFLSASAMFGAAAVYGHVTKRSLAGLGGYLVMGVVGLLVASIVNLFLLNSVVSWVISLVGVVIFTALTAFDVQRIQTGQLVALTGSVEKAAVMGALHLYLDFVNLFLFLLRLFGNRN
jgi:FtsH-binding integral membrane protein